MALVDQAKSYLLRLTSGRLYTEKEVREKLTKKYPALPSSEGDTLIELLLEYGFINDETYAERYISYCQRHKYYSRLKVTQYLLSHGVSRDIFSPYLENPEYFSEEATLLRFIEQKGLLLLPEQERPLWIGKLEKKGFPLGLIFSAFAQAEEHARQDGEVLE